MTTMNTAAMMAGIDVLGGAPSEFRSTLNGYRFDPGYMRPYINEHGVRCVSIRTGTEIVRDDKGNVVTNAAGPVYRTKYEEVPIKELIVNHGIMNPTWNAGLLPRDAWIKFDTAVGLAVRRKMIAYADLAANVPFGGFDAMAHKVLEYETLSDPGTAIMDMDGVADGITDRPLWQPEALPLPITYCDFFYTQRDMLASANKGLPVETISAEWAAQRVGELIEDVTIGTVSGMTWGPTTNYGLAPKVFGYLNYTNRVQKTDMTAPDGTNGSTILNDWLSLVDSMYDDNFSGPFMAYTSRDYMQYLNSVYSSTEPSAGSLRKMILETIPQVKSIKTLDRLDNTFTVILVQMTPEVVQAVTGMDITTVRWESKGGLQTNFRVMAIQVPRLKSDYYGKCGIGVGTTS